ncbi:hypothetical protein HPB47_027393 [Ixodes persulcatus]|uniref:Uncharacterized protein n=1 Tax=Ixodes persulcatus TaxID=34615 RepID=A0AC60PX88_IXOPE|nr:hypothetical protein HPB47_027393 [Ixodes persulcatus]
MGFPISLSRSSFEQAVGVVVTNGGGLPDTRNRGRIPRRGRFSLAHFGDDLSKFRPWTNVIFLSDAVKQLRLMYQDCFCRPGSEAESHAWRDVCLWAEELLSFSSVTGFVLARVIPKAHSSSEKSRMDFHGM